MMDDIAEQQNVAKEISEAISNPVAFGQVHAFYYCCFLKNLVQEFDEDELEAELDAFGERA